MKIQEYPAALIDLLNIKVGGKGLEQLKDEVQPVIETTDMYGLRQIDHTSVTSATIASAGNAINLSVPEGQTWLVYGFMGGVTLPDINDRVRMRLSIGRGSTQVGLQPDVDITALVANEFVSVGESFTRPLLVTAGDVLLVRFGFVLLNVAPSAVGFAAARIARVGPESRAIFA